MKKVIKLKEKGNEALQKGDYTTAINKYSEAIELDGKNHVLFSNRSHAFAKNGQYRRSLEDAERTIALKPDWGQGYICKGTAHTFLRRYEDAIKTFEEGIGRVPDDKNLKEAFLQAKAQHLKNRSRVANPFQMPGALTKLKADPRTQGLMEQPDFVAMVAELANTPTAVGRRLSDNRILTALNVLFDVDFKFEMTQ